MVGGGETERSNRGRRRSRGGEPERAERWFWGVVVVGEEIDREDEGWRLDVHNDMSESWNTSLQQR